MTNENELTAKGLAVAADVAPAVIKKLADLVEYDDPRVALAAAEFILRINWPGRLPPRWGGGFPGFPPGFGGDDPWSNPGEFGGARAG